MKKHLARWLLGLFGWNIIGERPENDRYVLIAAPHTSNWDFPLMLLFAAAFDIRVSWMAKHGLFRPPFGAVMRALGGISVRRHEQNNLVSQLVEQFEQKMQLVLVVPTEGTREWSDHWKSGFYRIALAAKVPIVPSFLDFKRRQGGFGPALLPSDDVKADMAYFREFYRGMQGKFPEKFGPIRLQEEDDGA